MTIILNGEKKELESESSILTLLTKHQLDPQLIVVEKNGTIIDKENFASENIHEGDKIELIRFIGGG